MAVAGGAVEVEEHHRASRPAEGRPPRRRAVPAATPALHRAARVRHRRPRRRPAAGRRVPDARGHVPCPSPSPRTTARTSDTPTPTPTPTADRGADGHPDARADRHARAHRHTTAEPTRHRDRRDGGHPGPAPLSSALREGARLRLDRHRLGLRRQRQRAAPRREGLPVAVLEAGRRYRDEDFAKTTWNARRYYWLPRLGLSGIFRMTLFKDVFVVSGCGVGGGSLGYANTLYRPRAGSAFYRDPQWAGLEDWESALAPHYETAEQMLGVTTVRGRGPRRHAAARARRRDGRPARPTRRPASASSSASPARPCADPYFDGEGPPRAGCIRCGACMVGCRHNAKNTLVKNYLYFAERAGVQILPERTVAEVRPLGAADGSGGYAVTSERSGAWFDKDRQTLTAKGVVVAAGPLGTNQLLQRCRHRRRAAAPLQAPRLPRAHQLRGDLRGHHQGRPPRLHEVDRDHLELLSRPRHAHRERHLRPGRATRSRSCSRPRQGAQQARRARCGRCSGRAAR